MIVILSASEESFSRYLQGILHPAKEGFRMTLQ